MDLRHRVFYRNKWWVPVALVPRWIPRYRLKIVHYDDIFHKPRERCDCAP
jgi:hypothetical protein